MRNYESIIILSPELTDEKAKARGKQIGELFEGKGATNLKVEEWGRREIAYVTKKKSHGFFLCFYFESENNEVINEVNESLRIMDDVLLFQSHRLDLPVRAFKGQQENKKKAA